MFRIGVDNLNPLWYNKEKRKEKIKMDLEDILAVLLEEGEDFTLEDYDDFFLIEVNTSANEWTLVRGARAHPLHYSKVLKYTRPGAAVYIISLLSLSCIQYTY